MEVPLQNGGIYKQVEIVSIKQETTDVKTFTLQPMEDIPYTPGQFLTFAFNHHHKEERRSFSISSTPVLNEPIAITLKRIDNGAWSRMLADRAVAGDVLYTTGAAGLFTLPANITTQKQLFFLAAGIGITPIFSLIKTALYSYPLVEVVLIYSNHNREETVFYNELVALRTIFADRFKVEFLFSSAFNLSRARLSKWLLPTLLNEYIAGNREGTLFYICGPFPYMRMVVYSLEEQGIPGASIRKENFDMVTHLPHVLPPDIERHMVSLHLHGTQYNFDVQYPNSILKAAKKLAIPIPYSCETGKCGSCTAVCKQGTVWQSYNEVLTDADLAAGKVLTCTGFPVHGNVVLDI